MLQRQFERRPTWLGGAGPAAGGMAGGEDSAADDAAAGGGEGDGAGADDMCLPGCVAWLLGLSYYKAQV